MPRETDIPVRITQLLESNQGKFFTSQHVSARLKTSLRTTRTHLLALVEAHRILRVYEYEGTVGSYRYFSRPLRK